MRFALTCLAVGLFVFSVGYADAQEMYVGAFGGYAMEAFDQDPVWTGLGADPDEVKGSFLAGVFVGYNVSEMLAVEGSFGYYFKFTPDESDLDNNELTLWSFMGSAKYRFGMDTEWTPYVIGGVGWGKLETDPATFMIPDQDGALDTEQSGMIARVGGGIEYVFGDNTMLVADVGYNFTFGDIEDWNFIDVRVGVCVGF
jgi:opacity protein-like surface antigen